MEGYIACGPVINGKLIMVLSFRKGRTVIGDYSALTNTRAVSSFQARSLIKGFIIHRKPFV